MDYGWAYLAKRAVATRHLTPPLIFGTFSRMARFIVVAPAADFPAGQCKVVDIEGVAVAVFHVGNEFFAIANRCPHKGNRLCDGELEGHHIVCPGHGWDFDLRTGETSWDPLIHRTYRVLVENGIVSVEP